MCGVSVTIYTSCLDLYICAVLVVRVRDLQVHGVSVEGQGDLVMYKVGWVLAQAASCMYTSVLCPVPGA